MTLASESAVNPRDGRQPKNLIVLRHSSLTCGGDCGLEFELGCLGGEGSQIMRMLIVTLSAALMLLSIAPQAGAAKSHLKCGGDNLQCGSLAKVCNPKNGKCCCMDVSR